MIVVLLVASHQGENPNLTDSPPSFFSTTQVNKCLSGTAGLCIWKSLLTIHRDFYLYIISVQRKSYLKQHFSFIYYYVHRHGLNHRLL